LVTYDTTTGKRRNRRFLCTAHKAPAVTMLEGELASVS
jgi:hypothetical protein